MSKAAVIAKLKEMYDIASRAGDVTGMIMALDTISKIKKLKKSESPAGGK